MRRVLVVLTVLGSQVWSLSSVSAAPGDLTLASTSDAGTKGNASSSGGGLSSDGTKVAFSSNATNLDPADTDSVSDAYVKDVTSGEITLVSTSDAGAKGNASSGARDLSADGTKVAFSSIATNLDPADTDSIADVYVKDLATGNITLASTSDAGVKGDQESSGASLSADGLRVAFNSKAFLDPADTDHAYTQDVYVKRIDTGDIVLASTDDGGMKVQDAMSLFPSLSANGNRVAFMSWANLDPVDTEDIGGIQARDTYVKDLLSGDVMLASADDTGNDGNRNSWEADISADGTKVAFYSWAQLDPADTDFTTDDVYVKDLTTGDVTLTSTSDFGVKGNGASEVANISGNGTRVAFRSVATNLDPVDNDTIQDVYVKEVGGPPGVPPCPPTGAFSDDLEPAADPGWTFDVARNDAPSPTWALVTDPLAHSSSHSFNTDAVAPAIKDDRLIAPPQDLSSQSRLIFWHRFNFEDGFDGGVLEVSTDGGTTWNDVLAGGGSFLEGGYNGTIDTGFESPIGGREAWTGASASINVMTKVEVSLGAFAGNDVRVRWRMGADNGFLTTGVGWWVDDVSFTALTVNCPPFARDDFATTVNGIPITISVLANDAEPNGETMTVTGITQPGHGTAVLNPDQTVTYDPVCAFQGIDTFTYTVSDSQGATDTGTVSVRARKTSRRGSFPC